MLSLRDLHAGYGRITVLRGVNLDVPDGSVVALIGSNGSGKTTTLRTISGLITPSQGEITLDGQSLVGMNPDAIARAGVAHVPEGRGVFPELTVKENLELGALTLPAAAVGAAIDEVLVHFPALHDRLGQRAGSLSGGEQQMLVIARGMVSRPRLLMIDEMSLGLAPIVLKRLFSVIPALNAGGTTILLVEQFLNLILPVLDYAYVLEKGQVALEGTRKEIAKKRTQLQASYIGRRHTTPVGRTR